MLDRRTAMLAGTAFVGAVAIPDAVGGAAEAGLAPAAELLAAVRKFLAGLEPDKRKAATFAWDGPEWRGWNYFGVGGYIKPGLRLERVLSRRQPSLRHLHRRSVRQDEERAAAGRYASGNGISNARSASRSPCSAPAEAGRGRSPEGPSTQSIVVRDNRIVSVTPSSFSALPNRITRGAHAGLVTLKDEEALARRLIGDLAPKLQARARLSDSALGNILSYAGRERANAQKVGLPAAELAAAQRDLVWQLIETYAVDYLSRLGHRPAPA
jgi:hypothetical protein